MNYIKQNHLSLLIILWLVVSGIFFGSTPNLVVTPDQIINALGAINRPRTTVTNPWTFEQGVIINSNADKSTNALTVAGTTTFSGASYDGFIANANFTMATTGVAASFRNTYGDMMCNSGGVYFNASDFSPSINFVAGTSTANANSFSMVASTTIATSTTAAPLDTMVKVSSKSGDPFYFPYGSYITASIGDYMAPTDASSTYYSRWDVEFAFPCWLMGP